MLWTILAVFLKYDIGFFLIRKHFFSKKKKKPGEKMNPEGMCALMDFREDGTTPYMLFFKDGLEEEKVVCFYFVKRRYREKKGRGSEYNF